MSPSLTRRELLRIGTVALGWPLLTAAAPPTRRARADACILLYMDGGASHLDLWDLKPEAPAEIRGPFRPIATSVPGVHVCEHLPLTARQIHRLAQVRSVRHEETVHDPAVYQMLTGRKHVSSAGNLKVDEATDFPHVGAAFGRVDQRPAILPKVVELPETMRMGARILPGQGAGFLGRTYDPFRVEVTPEAEVVPPAFLREPPMSRERQALRASLLKRFDRGLSALRAQAELAAFDRFQEQALELLAAPAIRQAFDLDREPPAVRDRYGRNRHGQSVLLARRLVEAGTRFVTVYWGKQMQDWADGQGPRLANNPWDTHRNHFPLVKDELLPPADRALSALVEDLDQRGLLERTLVLWMGDFGRTPRISKPYASRDHWPHANTVLLAGAGVTGGAVYGRTDRIAAEVTEHPVRPADLTATIIWALGSNPQTMIRDARGQAYPLSEGRPLEELFGG
ncbi:MAG: DUF1501 domain-containing protein [Isosphaeraceae bacterium]|nr:DUF1501 domain-containing protein [Isosphaeraceae bacterium]